MKNGVTLRYAYYLFNLKLRSVIIPAVREIGVHVCVRAFLVACHIGGLGSANKAASVRVNTGAVGGWPRCRVARRWRQWVGEAVYVDRVSACTRDARTHGSTLARSRVYTRRTRRITSDAASEPRFACRRRIRIFNPPPVGLCRFRAERLRQPDQLCQLRLWRSS